MHRRPAHADGNVDVLDAHPSISLELRGGSSREQHCRLPVTQHFDLILSLFQLVGHWCRGHDLAIDVEIRHTRSLHRGGWRWLPLPNTMQGQVQGLARS